MTFTEAVNYILVNKQAGKKIKVRVDTEFDPHPEKGVLYLQVKNYIGTKREGAPLGNQLIWPELVQNATFSEC